MKWTSGRRVAIAIAISTAMVLVIAGIFPRIYLANDDIGFTEYLRKDMFTPWISPILARGFGFAYLQAPDVPWYGLFQYALILATGAALIHTCTELIDQRPGLGRIATLLGALVIGASHAILVAGLTWTTVSISAVGTSVVAFIAHAQICQATGKPMSWVRALVYGLVFVSGYMLRLQGLGAVVVALMPLLAWAGLRFVRKRHIPRISALVAMVAPFVIVFAVQDRIPQARGADMTEFNRFNNERGKIHGHTAFEYLDTRAPDLLASAGWTLDEYRDFTSWLIINEDDYSLEKVERLLATGGVPEDLSLEWSHVQLCGIYADSSASILLFLLAVAAGVVLAWLGVVPAWQCVSFCLGYLVFMVGVPLWMAANFRFPQRVSLSFFTVAALAVFVYIARAIADQRAEPEGSSTPSRRTTVGLLVIAVFMFGWARQLIAWIDRDPWPDRDELQVLEDRVASRGGFVFVYVQAGLVELDPLRAEPRSYDGLQGGWGTFSKVWYETINRLGVHRGADVLHAMVDHPDAYLLAQAWARGGLENWIQRKVGNPSVRLALVDAAAIYTGGRPELYRLVTTPLARDTEEWRMMERDERAMIAALPGPPSVSGLHFRPVALAAPYERYVSPLRHPEARIDIAPIDGGIRSTVTAEPTACMVTDDDGHYGGVHVPIAGLRAMRFELNLINPENVIAVNIHALTKTSRSVRWRWKLSPHAQQSDQSWLAATFTLVPGSSDHRLRLAVDTANLRDLRDLHVFIGVKPGTQAGFELRKLEIAEP